MKIVLPVPHFPPARRPHRPGLTHRKAREIVVVNVALAILVAEVVQDLLVRLEPQGTGGGHLGLTPGEEP